MNTNIPITVRERVPTVPEEYSVISHNTDYTVTFDFDSEWTAKYKTVYFVGESGEYTPVVMEGDTCAVPEVKGDCRYLFIGVQEGTAEKPGVLKTSRACCLKIRDSITDMIGAPIPYPEPSVYEQIIAMLEKITVPTWSDVKNKPFSAIGDGLSVDEAGVLSAQGGSGGTPNAVKYVAQTLTDEQKAQARTNIGAGTSSFSGSYNDLTDKPTIPEGYTLPVATSDVLGGVKPAAKTDAMTSAVGVDADGKLWSAAGGGEWETITEITLTEAVNNVVINKDSNGNDFALKRVKVECVIQCNTEDAFTSIKTLLNGFTSSSNATLSGTQPVRYYSFYAELIPGSGALAWHNVSYNNYNWRSELQQMGYKYNNQWMQSSITSLTISPNDGGKNLGLAGTTIKVLGVRA